MFRIYTETESFDVSIEPKQTEDQPKQFDEEHILQFLKRKLRVFPIFSVFSGFFSVFFGLFGNSLFQLLSFDTETDSFDVSIEQKQTEDPPKQFKREYKCTWVFFRKFWVVSVCFGLFRFVTKQICLFQLFQYRFETPKQTEIFCFWFHETNRFEPKFIFVCFEDTLP